MTQMPPIYTRFSENCHRVGTKIGEELKVLVRMDVSDMQFALLDGHPEDRLQVQLKGRDRLIKINFTCLLILLAIGASILCNPDVALKVGIMSPIGLGALFYMKEGIIQSIARHQEKSKATSPIEEDEDTTYSLHEMGDEVIKYMKTSLENIRKTRMSPEERAQEQADIDRQQFFTC